MERYFYRLGRHIGKNKELQELIAMQRQNNANIVKMGKQGNTFLKAASIDSCRIINNLIKHAGDDEWSFLTWTPRDVFKEVGKESYLRIVKLEGEIIQRHRDEGVEIAGWHFPFIAKKKNPKEEIARLFKIEHPEIV